MKIRKYQFEKISMSEMIALARHEARRQLEEEANGEKQ